MSEKKPLPIKPQPDLPHCPVCGTISYSHSGVHPQCSARQFDANRVARRKQEEASGVSVVATKKVAVRVSPWKKFCPKCQVIQHFKKKSCVCGHTFEAQPPAGQGRSK